MAGDIKDLNEFDSDLSKYEAASLMHTEIMNQLKKANISTVTSSNQHSVPMLKSLWNGFAGGGLMRIRINSFAFLQLCRMDILDYDFAMEQLLCSVKLAKRPDELLTTLFDFLIIYSNKYSENSGRRRITSFLEEYYRNQEHLIPQILRQLRNMGMSVGFDVVLPFVVSVFLLPNGHICNQQVITQWLFDRAGNGALTYDLALHLCKYRPLDTLLESYEFLFKSDQLKKRFGPTLCVLFLKDYQAKKLFAPDLAFWLAFFEEILPLMPEHTLQSFAIELAHCLLILPPKYLLIAIHLVQRTIEKLRCPLYCAMFFTHLVNMSTISNHLKAISAGHSIMGATDIQKLLLLLDAKFQAVCTADHEYTSSDSIMACLCRRSQTVSAFSRAIRNQTINNKRTFSLLATLLLHRQSDPEIAANITDTIVHLAWKSPVQVHTVLPVFIQCASKELAKNDGATIVLNSLPRLAVHRHCTSPILQFLLALCSGQRTRITGYDLLKALYVLQPGIHAQIEPMIKDICRVKERPLMMAKMSLLSVICEERGYLHSDVILPILNQIFNEKTDSESGELVAMAVKAVADLCLSEVFQVEIAWSMLRTKLSNDKRSIVMCALCNFIGSIADDVVTDKKDLDEASLAAMNQLLNSLLIFLWKMVSSADSSCRQAAFNALSCYKHNDFDYKQLQTPEFGDMLNLAMKGKEELQLPGKFFGDLLFRLENNDLVEFSTFLARLIAEEVESIGRGALHSAKVAAANLAVESSSLNEMFASLTVSFASGGSPVIDKNTAVAILLTFQPRLEMSIKGDGVMGKSSISAGRQYVQTLKKLLFQVSFDVDDFRRTLITPFGWLKFVDRCYIALIAGHCAELERIPGKGGNSLAEQTAFLWVRDQITEVLKTAWRDNIESRTNCCFVLAALALALKKFINANIVDPAMLMAESFIGCRQWFIICVETLLNLCNFGYSHKSNSLIFYDLSQAPASDVICASRLAISFLLPSVSNEISTYLDNQSDEALQQLKAALVQKTDTNRTELFFNWLSLGILFAESQRYTNDQATKHPWTNVFLDWPNDEYGWLSVAVAVALCNDEIFAEETSKIMLNRLETLDDPTDLMIYSIGVTLSVVCPDMQSLTRSELVQNLKRHLDSINRSKFKAPPALAKCFMSDNLAAAQWSLAATLDDQLLTSDDKMSAFQQSCSSCGADYFMIGFVGEKRTFDDQDRSMLNELCKRAKNAKKSTDPFFSEYQLNLAMVYFSSKFVADHEVVYMPQDYSYLKENSILRPCMEGILSQNYDELRISCVLKAMGSSAVKHLPPIDWRQVFDALPPNLRAELDLTIARIATREKSTALLKRLLHAAVFKNLSVDAKKHLMKNLVVLAECNNMTSLRRSIDELSNELNHASDHSVRIAAVEGLRIALAAETDTLTNQSTSGASSIGNKSLLVDWLANIIAQVNISCYADFCRTDVQILLYVFAKLSDDYEEHVFMIQTRKDDLKYLALRLKRTFRQGVTAEKAANLCAEVVLLLPESLKPSALLILMHLLNMSTVDKKYQEEYLVALMNAILLWMKTDGNKQKITTSFEIFLAAGICWFSHNGSLPIGFLCDTTPEHGMNCDYDNQVSSSLYQLASNDFATAVFTINRANSLAEKIVDWIVQMLPVVDAYLNKQQTAILIEFLQHAKETKSFERKLTERNLIEEILRYAQISS